MVDLFKGIKNFVPESKAEFKRLGIQGQSELANALFNGSAFVPYGPGQYTPDVEQEKQQSYRTPSEQEQNNDGIER